MEKKRMKRKGEGEKGKDLDVLKKDLCLGLFLNYFGHAQELQVSVIRTSASQGRSSPPPHCPASHAVPYRNEEYKGAVQTMKSEW